MQNECASVEFQRHRLKESQLPSSNFVFNHIVEEGNECTTVLCSPSGLWMGRVEKLFAPFGDYFRIRLGPEFFYCRLSLQQPLFQRRSSFSTREILVFYRRKTLSTAYQKRWVRSSRVGGTLLWEEGIKAGGSDYQRVPSLHGWGQPSFERRR